MNNPLIGLRKDIKRLLLDLRQDSWKKLFKRLAYRFCRATKHIIYYLDLLKELSPLPSIPIDVEVKEVTITELNNLRLNAKGLTSDFFRDKIGVEERSFIATVSGDLAFIIWTSSQNSSGLVTVTPNTVEMNYAYCLPEYRRRQLYFTTISYMSHKLKMEGIRGIWAVPDSDNDVSINYIIKAGFEKIGELYRWGFITWKKGKV